MSYLSLSFLFDFLSLVLFFFFSFFFFRDDCPELAEEEFELKQNGSVKMSTSIPIPIKYQLLRVVTIEIVVNLERECLYAQYYKQCDKLKTKSQLFSNLNKTWKTLDETWKVIF